MRLLQTTLVVLLLVASAQADDQTTTDRIKAETLNKLNSIVLPDVSLQDVEFANALKRLEAESRRLSVDGVGVKIRLSDELPEFELVMPPNLDDELREAIEKMADQRFPKHAQAPAKFFGKKRIAVQLRRIPLGDALKLITGSIRAGFCIRSDGIVEIGYHPTQLEARIYRTSTNPFEIESVSEVRQFFTGGYEESVHFSYLKDRKLLIFLDTPENAEDFDKALRERGDAVPFEPAPATE